MMRNAQGPRRRCRRSLRVCRSVAVVAWALWAVACSGQTDARQVYIDRLVAFNQLIPEGEPGAEMSEDIIECWAEYHLERVRSVFPEWTWDDLLAYGDGEMRPDVEARATEVLLSDIPVDRCEEMVVGPLIEIRD